MKKPLDLRSEMLLSVAELKSNVEGIRPGLVYAQHAPALTLARCPRRGHGLPDAPAPSTHPPHTQQDHACGKKHCCAGQPVSLAEAEHWGRQKHTRGEGLVGRQAQGQGVVGVPLLRRAQKRVWMIQECERRFLKRPAKQPSKPLFKQQQHVQTRC